MAKIFEINKLLNLVADLTLKIEAIDKKFIKHNYEQHYFSNEISSFDDVLLQAHHLEFIENKKNIISLTNTGKIFSDMTTKKNGKKILDVNAIQIKFLQELIINSKNLRNRYSKIFVKFHTDYVHDPPIWSILKNKIDESEMMLIHWLMEINIVKQINETIQVDEKYSFIVSAIINGVVMTLGEFERRLEYQKLIGDLGEKLTLDHEIDRLFTSNDADNELSYRVKRISMNNLFAGFDILSFIDINSNPDEYDKFIEVKATGGLPHFFWSRNEIEKAKQLREKYWIYLWTNINDKNSRKLQVINDPYKKFFENSKIKPEPTEYEISKNILDNLHDQD